MNEIQNLSPELQAKLSLIDQVTNAGSLMEQGNFPKAEAGKIFQALNFLHALKNDLVEDVKKHPEAYKVPALNVPAPHLESEPDSVA